MRIRSVRLDDAEAVAAIYAPIVRDTWISFETEPPGAEEMRERIAGKIGKLPWLVSTDDQDAVTGYVYASMLRDRAAYQWSVEVTAYVREDSRGRGLGSRLYLTLFDELKALGYCQAFAGIALPNDASVALHESVGFKPLGVYRKVGYKLDSWRDVGWWQKEVQAPAPRPCAPLKPAHALS